MPRKGYIAKRDVLPDPIYNSKLVTKLINKIMIDGKRGTAQTILYNAFAIIEEKTGQNAMEVFEKAPRGVFSKWKEYDKIGRVIKDYYEKSIHYRWR